MNGSLAIAKMLVERGADVTAKDNDGLTPLDVATFHQKDECEKYLSGRMIQQEIWDLWIMVSRECISYVQWLPQEIIEDIMEIITES